MTQSTYPQGPPAPVPGANAPPPPPRRSNGKILAGVIATVVVLAGAGGWYLFLSPFSPLRGLDATKVESEIVRVTEEVGLTPTDVQCPDSIPIETGRVDTCTATVEGQQVTYTVAQSDDQGNVKINSRGFVVVSQVEALLRERVGTQAGVEVVAECADGARVVIGGPGTTVNCTVSDAANPDDFAEFTGTVTDDQGTVDFG
jgi:hypothetical protein